MKSAKPLPWTYLRSYPKSWQVDMAHPFLNSVTCQSVLWRWTHVTYLHTMHVLKHGCKLDINQISLLFGFLATFFNTSSSSCCFKLLRLNTASLGTFSAETRTLLNPHIHMPYVRQAMMWEVIWLPSLVTGDSFLCWVRQVETVAC